MKEYHVKRGEWPDDVPVSDGLTLPCRICHKKLKFDYTVDDDFWKRVVDQRHKNKVICLLCLDKLASVKGENVAKHLIRVQFIGVGKTINLLPDKVFYYRP